jgi:hypothetical protein
MSNELCRHARRHILHTGQNYCYDATGREIDCQGSGQDAEFLRGAPWPLPRFEVQGSVAEDHATGLSWTIDANIGGFPCTWLEAFAQIAELNQQQHGGYRDWRLPNRNELRSLVSYQAKNPALPAGHPFINFFLGWYWSSTTAAINPAYAWSVHLEGARMFYGRKDQEYLFWPVRGEGNGLLPCTGQQRCFNVLGKWIECAGSGQDGDLKLGSPWPSPRFNVRGDVVHDRLTDLFWLRHADLTGKPINWQQALASTLEWGAHRTEDNLLWRLPTINELASLVDCDVHSPALPPGHPFAGLCLSYWSSTTSCFETDWAWVLYLDKGACGVGHKPLQSFYAWPVGVMPCKEGRR